MSTASPHEPTAQEDAIYQALTSGDHDTIQQLGEDATAAGPEELAQYETDYGFAWTHYQADHEAPEDEREEQTAAEVQDENQDAAGL